MTTEETWTPDSTARSQLVVYFADAPAVDHDALERFVNETDPDETDKCTIETVTDLESIPVPPGKLKTTDSELRMGSALATLGDFNVAILYHNCPDPSRTLDAPRIPEEMRATLKGHGGFALLSLFGGAHYAPIERLVFLMKLAYGMCEQGALGVGLMDFDIAYTYDFLKGLQQMTSSSPGNIAEMMRAAAAEKGEEIDEEVIAALLAELPDEMKPGETTLWQVMRSEFEPIDLVSSVALAEVEGSTWIVSRGHVMYGLPEFAYELESEGEFEEILNYFRGGLIYMLQNGPVLQPGDTFGSDENAIMRLHEPETGREDWLVNDENGTLVMRREKKKGMLGRLFGR